MLLNDKVDSTAVLTDESFMLIRDVLDDDDANSFKMGDFLMSSPEVSAVIDELGCWSTIYQIKDIEYVRDESDAVIRRLYVRIPASPMDYILSSNVHAGAVPVTVTQNEIKKRGSRGRALLENAQNGNDVISLDDFGTNFKIGPFKKVFEGGQSVTFKAGPDTEFVFSGSGTMTLSAGAEFALSLSLEFEFDWDIFTGDIYVYFTLSVDYGLSLTLGAELLGQVMAEVNDIFNIGKTLTFAIGPVPVIIRPFVSLSASITSVPLGVEAGVECHYGETIMMGYVYEETTTFHAEYGLVKSNARYTLGTVYSWTTSELQNCVRYNYYAGVGSGLTCVWFDYNAASGRCRCLGPGVMIGATADESGTNAYIMNRECNGLYTVSCDLFGCGFEIAVSDRGSNGCFWGSRWQCNKCPLFQSNSGYAEKKVLQDNEINERTAHDDNGCTPYFDLKTGDDDEEECPALQFGFDIEVSLKIGCNFYSLVTVYGRAAIEIPFRINVPEMDSAICPDAFGSCGTDDLVVSSTVAMDLVFYVGVEVDFGQLEAIIDAIVGASGADNVEVDAGIETEVASVSILPVTPIFCTTFSEAFSFLDASAMSLLDDYVREKCCDGDAATDDTDQSTDEFEETAGTCDCDCTLMSGANCAGGGGTSTIGRARSGCTKHETLSACAQYGYGGESWYEENTCRWIPDAEKETAVACTDSTATATARYIHIHMADDWLNLMEVTAYDASGAAIPAANAVLSTTYGAIYSASNCIDGDTSTMCHGGSASYDWLQIDLGSAKEIKSVLVVNRDDCCRDRIDGAVLSLFCLDDIKCEDIPESTTQQWIIHADSDTANVLFDVKCADACECSLTAWQHGGMTGDVYTVTEVGSWVNVQSNQISSFRVDGPCSLTVADGNDGESAFDHVYTEGTYTMDWSLINSLNL